MSRHPVVAGVGFSLATHLATLAIPMVLALRFAAPDNAYDEDRTWFFLYGSLLGQFLLFLLVIIVGATLASYRPHRRAGAAVFAGWGIGVLTMPFLWVALWHHIIHPGGRVEWIWGLVAGVWKFLST